MTDLVITGNPTPEEIAAVVAVLSTAGHAHAPAVTTSSRWATSLRRTTSLRRLRGGSPSARWQGAYWPGGASVLVALSVAASLLLGAGSLLVAAPASAHDVLIGSDPAAGSTVTTVPAAVILTFTEPVLDGSAKVRVTGPTGEVTGAVGVRKAVVTAALSPGLTNGRYTVLWRVTSNDGHPVSGTVTFTLTAATPTTSPPATSPAATPIATPAVTPISTPVEAGTSPDGRRLALAVTLVLAAGVLAVVIVTVRRRRA